MMKQQLLESLSSKDARRKLVINKFTLYDFSEANGEIDRVEYSYSIDNQLKYVIYVTVYLDNFRYVYEKEYSRVKCFSNMINALKESGCKYNDR